tara:strand:- start:86 stop:1204 length:1119 start_codon:yes stop_codon:yes gene_type:complete
MAKKPNYLLNPSQDDRMQALFSGLGAAGQGFQNPDPTMPTSFAQSLTRGLSGFNRGFGQQTQINKADQLADMQAQQQQAQIQAQQMKIEQEKERQRNLAQYQNIIIDPETMNPQGLSENEAFARAFPDIVAKQKAQALFPSIPTSRQAADIQKFRFREGLVGQFGESSREVKSFDQIEGFDTRTLEYLRKASGIKPTQEAAVKMKVLAMDQADAAINSYEKATTLLKDLENKDYNFESGAAADLRLGILKLRELVDSDPDLRKRIMNTEFMTSRMGSEVFGMIKALGIGARGLDTPAEREFMQEVLTGKVTLNRDTLIKMARLRQQTSKDRINKFYKRTKSGVFDDIFAESGRTRGEYNLGETDLKSKYGLK